MQNSTELIIWHNAVKGAEDRCHIRLLTEIEAYLVSLLMRFSKTSDLARRVMAEEFLRGLNEKDILKRHALAAVGDQCLLVSGLFPGLAERRLVKISYFVELGRSAYANISSKSCDIYGLLAQQFVQLMDVLIALNERHILLPMEAYELWRESGSKRAHEILQSYRQNH